MLAKKVKTMLGKDKKLSLYLPDVPSGEVEVIILGTGKGSVSVDDVLADMPKHKLGKMSGSLRREVIYHDAR